MEDADLLSQYAQSRSEDAFAQLVRRHVDLVYSAAIRQSQGDVHRAKDVTQTVFVALARQAKALSRRRVLVSWLYTTTRFTASALLRAERRRTVREEQFYVMQEIRAESSSPDEWSKVRPVVDAAMATLSLRDQEAVLLRFFNGASLAFVGQKLGISEDAAQKRVDRALDRLRHALMKRGITSTASFIATALAQQAVAAAPIGTAAAVTGAVGASATTGVAGGVWALTHFMSMSKASLGIVTALVVAGSAGLFWQQLTNAHLRRQIVELTTTADQGERRQLATAQASIAKLEASEAENQAELAKVHDELADFKRRAQALATARAKRRPTGGGDNGDSLPALQSPMTPIESGKNEGLASATSSFRSAAAAIAQGNIDLLATMIGFTPDGRRELDEFFAKLPPETRAQFGSPEKVFATLMAARLPEIESVGVVSETPEGPDTELLRMRMQNASGRQWDDTFTFQRGANGWLARISDRTVDSYLKTLSSVPSLPPANSIPGPSTHE